MLLPIEHVWGKSNLPQQVVEEAVAPVLLEEKKAPAAKPASISIPLPTLPEPETIQNVCLVLTVVLLFFILLELKHLVKVMAKLR